MQKMQLCIQAHLVVFNECLPRIMGLSSNQPKLNLLRFLSNILS